MGDEATAIARARAELYGLFAGLLLERPSEVLKELGPERFLQGLREAFGEVEPEGVRLLERALNSDSAADHLELDLDHDNLFRAPGPSYVPPYGSSWLEGLLWQGSTRAVLRGYRRAGLLPPQGVPPDHLGLVLAFLGHLCHREAAGEEVQGQRREFLDYLESWVGRFCAELERKASTDFYRGIARLLRAFLELEVYHDGDPDGGLHRAERLGKDDPDNGAHSGPQGEGLSPGGDKTCSP